MDIRIFDRDIILIGLIDTFKSFRFKKKFYDLGECELHIPFTSENLSILKKDNIIYVDSKTSFIIHTVLISIDEEGNEVIQVMAKDLIYILSKRINYNQIVMTNALVNNVISKLLNDNIISPTDTKRKIGNILIGNLVSASNINYQNTYGNILEELYSICKSVDTMPYAELDYIDKKIKINTIKGLDRSINQTDRSYCIFSQDFENVKKQEYLSSNENYKNVCLVAGAGEGASRKKVELGTASGLDRVELFVDSRDLSDKKSLEDGTEIDIPLVEYNNILAQRGNEKLSEYLQVETFDSEIDLNSNLVYGVDFSIGDTVTVMNNNWQLVVNAKITEVEEVWEDSKTMSVVFGNNIPTLVDKIKIKMR